MHNKATQLYKYMYPFSPKLPSHPGCLIGKTVLTVMVPILINKDVFEPSYNDLKFRGLKP